MEEALDSAGVKTSPLEYLQQEVTQANEHSEKLEDKNVRLQKQIGEAEKNSQLKSQQVTTQAKQNEGLVEELNKVYEENKTLRKAAAERTVV